VHAVVREEAEEALVVDSGAAAEVDPEAVVEAGLEEVVVEDAVEVEIVAAEGMPGVESGHVVDSTASSTASA
jgi:hypothetical protein